MIFVFPGMGASADMYSGLWRKMKDAVFVNWPLNSKAESIPDLAAEMIEAYAIKNGDSVIGTSLGGMVACEIANIIQLNHLVLIGSAVQKNEVNSFLKFLSPLVKVTPLEFVQKLTGKMGSDCIQMFADCDPHFIRNMCRAIFKWEGLVSTIKPIRIHGTHDLIIPPPADVDLQVKGGHLIAMTHPEECVIFLRKILT
jgi:pimeloyl-ACP methyl ester carboxylesterase